MSYRSGVDERDKPGVVHLLWIVPVILVAFVGAYALSYLSWCGVSACNGGGLRVKPDVAGALSFLAVGGLFSGALLWFIPWTAKKTARRIVAVVAVVAFVGLPVLKFVSQ